MSSDSDFLADGVREASIPGGTDQGAIERGSGEFHRAPTMRGDLWGGPLLVRWETAANGTAEPAGAVSLPSIGQSTADETASATLSANRVPLHEGGVMLAADGPALPVLSTARFDVSASSTSAGPTTAVSAAAASPVLLNAVYAVANAASYDGYSIVASGTQSYDELSILSEGDGAGQVGVDGTVLRYGGVAIGTIAGSGTDEFSITFNASASRAAIEAVVGRIAYRAGEGDHVAHDVHFDLLNAGGVEQGQRSQWDSPVLGPNPFWNLPNLGRQYHVAVGDVNGDGQFDLITSGTRDDPAPQKFYLDDYPYQSWFWELKYPNGQLMGQAVMGVEEVGARFYIYDALGPKYALPDTATTTYISNGQGQYAEGYFGISLSDLSASVAVALADLDNDGDLDILYASTAYLTSNFVVNWSSNNGEGVFTNRGALTGVAVDAGGDLSFGQELTVAYGDVNGDGVDDILLAGSTYVHRYQNSDGSWTDGARILDLSVMGGGNKKIALVDFDDDGDLDLYVRTSDGRSHAFANDGTGQFTLLDDAHNPFAFLGTSAWDVSFADINRDGRTDLIVSSNGRANVYFNSGFAGSGAGFTAGIDFSHAAPTGIDTVASLREGGVHALLPGEFALTDADGDGFGGIVVDSVPTAGSLTLDGVAVTAGQTISGEAIAQGRLLYAPAAGTTGEAADGFTYFVVDSSGEAASIASKTTFDVAAVAKPGVLAGLEPVVGESTGWTAIAPNAVFADGDAMQGGVLTVSGLLADDEVRVRDGGAEAGAIGLSGTDVTYGGVVIGTLAGGAGTPLTVTFTAAATEAAVQALVRNIVLSPGQATGDTSRTLTIGITDGAGHGLGAAPGAGWTELTGADNPLAAYTNGTNASAYFVERSSGHAGKELMLDAEGRGAALILARDESGNLIDISMASETPGPNSDGTVPANAIQRFDYSANYHLGGLPEYGFLTSDGYFGTYAGFWSGNPFQGRYARLYTFYVGVDIHGAGYDIDGDGFVEFIAGNADGTLTPYTNSTAEVSGGTIFGFNALSGTNNPFEGITADGAAIPTFWDYDGDGDQDLLLGNEFGYITTYRNDGGTFMRVADAQNPFRDINLGSNGMPAFGDLDGDGIDEMVVGQADGSYRVFKQASTVAHTVTVDVTTEWTNVAPSGSDRLLSISEDADYSFTVADFGFTDGDGNALSGVVIATLPTDGTLTLNGVAVVAGQEIGIEDIVAGAFVFTPAADRNGESYAGFTFQVRDDGGTAHDGVDLDPVARTITFDVTPVNDAPVGADAAITINEDGSHVFGVSDFGFTDVDGDAFESVTIATVPAAGALTLDGVAVVAGQVVSAADIAAGLLVFTPAANANGDGYASLTFQLRDDGGTANGGVDLDPVARTITVDVTPVNDAPTGTDGSVTMDEDVAYAITLADFGYADADGDAFESVTIATVPAAGALTLDGAEVVAGQVVSAADIAAGRLVFTPAANANGDAYASLTFQVQSDGIAADDSIDLDATPNTLTFNVLDVNEAPTGADAGITINEDGRHVFGVVDFGFSDFGGDAFQSVTIATVPAAGALTLNGVAVVAGQVVSAADIAAGRLVFTPAANANGDGYASLSFQVRDDGGTANGGVDLDPVARTITVDVTPVNDAPTGTDATIAIDEDGSYSFGLTDFGFTDVDGDAFESVTIATVPAAGALTLDGVAVVAGQVVSAADIAAGRLVFTPAANANGDGYASLTFQLRDDGGTANGGVDLDPVARTITVDVTPVNDTPTGTDGSVTMDEDVAYAITLADFGYADADGDAFESVTIATVPAAGALTLDGAEVVAGQVVSAADIAAGRLVFTPAANANGDAYASLTFQVQSDGIAADDGVDLDATPNTLTFNVLDVNEAPAGADAGITINEDGRHVFGVGDFGFSDFGGDAFESVTIATVPAAGALTLNGVAVVAGQVVSAADIAAGQLVFTPAANANGDGYASLTFQVRDDGGTANGGVDLDPVARTITVDVTPVADAPEGFDATITIDEDGSYSFGLTDFEYYDADGDALAGVRITSLPAAGTLTLDGVAVTEGQVVATADIAAGLLVFAPAAEANGTGYAEFQFQLQDVAGGIDPSPRTITVDVTPVDDAATLNVTAAVSIENADTVLIAPDAVYAETDRLDGGVLSVTGLLGSDTLSVRNQGTGAGEIGFVDGTITYGGIAIGTLDEAEAGAFSVTFNAATTDEAVQALMRNLLLTNSAEQTTERALSISITDGDGGTANDTAPHLGWVELTGDANPLAGIQLGPNATAATIGFTRAQDNLNDPWPFEELVLDSDGTDQAWVFGWTGENYSRIDYPVESIHEPGLYAPLSGGLRDWDSFNASLNTGWGRASAIGMSADGVVQSFYYQVDFQGLAFPILYEFQVAPGGSLATIHIDGDGRQEVVIATAEGDLRTFVVGNGSHYELTGLDNPFFGIHGDGKLTPTFWDYDGDGDRDLIVVDPAGNMRTYRNDGGTFVKTAIADDPFGTINVGAGGDPTLIDLNRDGRMELVVGQADGTFRVFTQQPTQSATVGVTIARSNAPDGIDTSVTATEETVYIFSTSDFAMADADGDRPASLTILELPENGTLYDTSGGAPVEVVVGQTISWASIASGALRYVPAKDVSGEAADGFTYQLRDDGQGSATLDPNPTHVTINIDDVNDAAVISAVPSLTMTEDEAALGQLMFTGVSLTDVDGGMANGFMEIGNLSADEGITVRDQGDSVGEIGFDGTHVRYGGVEIGTVTANGDGTFRVTLNDAATIEAAEALLQNLVYTNSSDAPQASRDLVLTIHDGDGQSVGSHPTMAEYDANAIFGNMPSGNVPLVAGYIRSDVHTLSEQIYFGGIGYAHKPLGGYDFTRIAPLQTINGWQTLGSTGTGAVVSDDHATWILALSQPDEIRYPVVEKFKLPNGVEFKYLTTASLSLPGARSIAQADGQNFFIGMADGTVHRYRFNTDHLTIVESPLDRLSTIKVDGAATVFTISGLRADSNEDDDLVIFDGNGEMHVYRLKDGYYRELSDAEADFYHAANLQMGDTMVGFDVNHDGINELVVSRVDGTTDIYSMGRADGIVFNVGVTPVNDAPTANPDSYSVDQDGILKVTAENGPVNNDTDPDGDTMLAMLMSGTTHGTVMMNPDGTFTYIPSSGYHGIDSFTYRVTDGSVFSETTTVTITVNPPNEAPSGTDKTVTLDEDVPVTLTVADFGFTDTDGDALAAVLIGAVPLAGVLTLDGVAVVAGQSISAADIAAGKLVFTPAADANGAGYSTLTFQVRDDGGTTIGGVDLDATPNTLTFDVTPVDDPVSASDDTASIAENETVKIAVADNDIDRDGGAAETITQIAGQAVVAGGSVTLASGAIVTLNLDGTLTYDPNHRFDALVSALTATLTGAKNSTAPDRFSYTLSGGSQAWVDVIVTGVDSVTDQLTGSIGNDVITGRATANLFDLRAGGSDTAIGGAADDGFFMGGGWDADDVLDGGAGTMDQVGIQGDYAGGLMLGANSVSGIEMLVFLAGSDARFGGASAALHAYSITTHDNNVVAGQQMIVQANQLLAGESLTFNGAAETDGSFLFYGGLGTDHLTGGQNNDAFYFGLGRFGAGDMIDGQGGSMDQFGLQGDYSGGNAIVFGANQLTGIEMMVLLSGAEMRFSGGNVGAAFSYTLTMHDNNAAAGTLFTVQANQLRAGEVLTIDASAETDANYRIFAGAGSDTLIGGALADQIWGNAGDDVIAGRGGADSLYGGAGHDRFVYHTASDSTAEARDHIHDFESGDAIDLSALGLSTFTSGGLTGSAGEVTATYTGTRWLIEGDIDGDGIADLSIEVDQASDYSWSNADFGLAAPVMPMVAQRQALDHIESVDGGGLDNILMTSAFSGASVSSHHLDTPAAAFLLPVDLLHHAP